jgi:hypothetical protein
MAGHMQSEPELPFAQIPANKNTEKQCFGFHHFLSSVSSTNQRLLPSVIFSVSLSGTTSYHLSFATYSEKMSAMPSSGCRLSRDQ